MTEAAPQENPVLVDYLKFESSGEPYLEGSKCSKCGTTYLGSRMGCSKCFARADAMETIKLPTSGELYTYTIVYRSYPGIEVPFISATVDLDDACAIKGTLIDVEPDPEHVKSGMRVELVFKELEYKNKEGIPYVSYFFQPAA